MNAVDQLAPTVGIASACEALGVARASFYRQPVFGPALPVALRPTPARALSVFILCESLIKRGSWDAY